MRTAVAGYAIEDVSVAAPQGRATRGQVLQASSCTGAGAGAGAGPGVAERDDGQQVAVTDFNHVAVRVVEEELLHRNAPLLHCLADKGDALVLQAVLNSSHVVALHNRTQGRVRDGHIIMMP